ncbi:MAG: hypothetical protein V4603_01610 [Pseudomonadota bacterium]
MNIDHTDDSAEKQHMNSAIFFGSGKLACMATAMLMMAASLPAFAQNDASAQVNAAFDPTGYWVSIITEDWQFRMVTPVRGEYGDVPLNPEGRRVADNWDSSMDEADSGECRAFGAAGLMRVPGRLYITWETPDTLRIDTDAGTQSRLLHFQRTSPEGSEPSLQGNSNAQWQAQGNLKVVTTNMSPGYLRKNGVPYSDDAQLSEFYELVQAPNQDEWLFVTSIVEDPLYLRSPYVTSTHFRKLPNAEGWSPQPCAKD